MKLFDVVRLKRDLRGVAKGREGTIVDVLRGVPERVYYAVEFLDDRGYTLGVPVLTEDYLEFVTEKPE